HSVLQEEAGEPIQLSAQAEAALMDYPWPGNLRQLRHILRTMVVLCDGNTLGLEHIPVSLSEASVNAPAPMPVATPLLTQPAVSAPETDCIADAATTITDALNPLQVT